MEPEGRLLPDSKLERVRWELSREERLVYAATSKEERLWTPCSGSNATESASELLRVWVSMCVCKSVFVLIRDQARTCRFHEHAAPDISAQGRGRSVLEAWVYETTWCFAACSPALARCQLMVQHVVQDL